MISINPLNINYKNLSKYYTANVRTAKYASESFSNIQTNTCYPASYYALSFSGGRKTLTLNEQMQRLDADKLPAHVFNRIKETLDSGNPENKTIYDIHTEIYGALFECKTLDEAKKMYPEFNNVLDAKDIKESDLSPTLKNIKNGELEGADIEDLTLTLLKTHYAKGISPNLRAAYFGLSKDATTKIFEKLNIERLDGQYLRLVGDCNPEKRKRVSAGWTPEKRAEHAKKANEVWSDEVKRAEQSRKRKEYFEAHPEAALEISERLKGNTPDAETRAKISESKKCFYREHPEFARLRSESFKEHSAFVEKMSEIARNEFPYLRVIFLKRAQGKTLEDYEVKYIERYYKRCDEVYPNGQQAAGKTFSRMWREYKESCKDEN